MEKEREIECESKALKTLSEMNRDNCKNCLLLRWEILLFSISVRTGTSGCSIIFGIIIGVVGCVRFSSGTHNRQRDEEENKNLPIVTKDEQRPGEMFCWRMARADVSVRVYQQC